ncbi:MAG: hypothetical protein R6U11_03130 [Bacteroidales bacterium]
MIVVITDYIFSQVATIITNAIYSRVYCNNNGIFRNVAEKTIKIGGGRNEDYLDKYFDSWAAGFWEGEGSIIKKTNKIGFIISLCQSFDDKRDVEKMMTKLKNTYGGHFCYRKQNKHYPNSKKQLMWRITKGSDVIKFIKQIYPYCEFRKNELKNALDVYEKYPQSFTKFKIINIDKAKELREKGLTYVAIGKILNEYPGTIFKRLNYYNIS